MRLLLVFVLLLDPSIETRMAILAVLPFVTLFAGLFLGAAIGRDGLAYQFRRHIDKHFFQVGPTPGCSFCKMERGLLCPGTFEMAFLMAAILEKL